MQGSWVAAIVALGMAAGISGASAAAAQLPPADLREIEQLLAQLNFDPGDIDGKVDDRTRTAIRLYQEFAVLPVDGEPSERLLNELRQVSQVYAQMREETPAPAAAETAPAPESAPETAAERPAELPAEPEPAAAPLAGAESTAADAAPSEPAPAQAAEAAQSDAMPEAPAAEAPAADAPATEAPATEAPIAATDAPEPADVDSTAPAPTDSAVAETQRAKLEPEPAAAKPPEPAQPATEPTAAEPPASAAEPAPESETAPPAEPAPAVAQPALPEPKPDMAEAPAAKPQAAPEAEAPKATAGFNLSGMIARLKQRDAASAPAKTTQTARAATTRAITDRASYERTMIWKVQQELRRIGLDPGAADGNMRPRTTEAIETYQRARGLPADGRVTEELLARLQVESPTGKAAPRPPDAAATESAAAPSATATVPSNGYQAFDAGYDAAQSGDYGTAVKLYDQAIDGGDLALEHLATALYNRANAYQYLGVLDKAIEDYSAAIANKPSFPAAYYNRGFALDMKGEKARAVEDFRKARDLGLQRLGVRSPDLPPPLL